MPQSAGHTITKTTKVKASDGTVLWSVSITASFTYDGAAALHTAKRLDQTGDDDSCYKKSCYFSVIHDYKKAVIFQ